MAAASHTTRSEQPIETLVADARAAFDRGAFVRASHLWRDVVTRDPNRAGAWFGRGLALARRSRWADALAQYQEAAQRGLDSAELHEAQGRAHAELNDTDAAIVSYRKAVKANPRLVAGHLGLSLASSIRGDDADALKHGLVAFKLRPHDDEVHKMLRQVLPQVSGERKAAVRRLRVAARMVGSPDVHALLALTLLAANDQRRMALNEACRALEHVRRGRPLRLDLVESIAKLLSTPETPSRLRAVADEAISAAAPQIKARWARALADDSPARHPRAIELFCEALATAPGDPEVHVDIQQTAAGQSFVEQLFKAAEVILTGVTDVTFRLRWAETLTFSGLPERGLALLEALAKADVPEELAGPFAAARGHALANLERWDEAARHMVRALELGHQPPVTIHFLHQALGTGTARGAISELRRLARSLVLRTSVAAAMALHVAGEADDVLLAAITERVLAGKDAGAAFQWGSHLQSREELDRALACFEHSAKLAPDDHASLAAAGRVLRSKKAFEAAFESYSAAVAADPDQADVYDDWTSAMQEDSPGHALAEIFAGRAPASALCDKWTTLQASRARHVARAERLRMLLEENCDDPDTYLDCSRRLLSARIFPEAERVAAQGCMLGSSKSWGWAQSLEQWGIALWRLDRLDEAVQKLGEAIAAAPTRADGYRIRGQILLRKSDFAAACSDFESAVQHASDNVTRARSYDDWALALSELKEYDASLEKSALALQLEPDDYWLHFRRAYTLTDLGRNQEAIEEYLVTERLEPDNPYAPHNIAYMFERRGEYARARAHWSTTRELYQKGLPDALKRGDPEHCVNYGRLVGAVGQDLDEAEALLRAALLLEPGHTDALAALACVYVDRRKKRTEVNAQAPGERSGHEGHTESYWRASQCYHEGRLALQRRLSRSRDARTLMDMGELHLLMDEYEESEKAFKEALALNRSSTRARKGLGEALLHMGQHDAAIASLRDASKADPDDIGIRSKLAEAYLRSRRLDEAESEYLRVLSITEFHVDSHLGLGEAYVEMAEKKDEEDDLVARDDFYALATEHLTRAIEIAGSDNRPISLTGSQASAYYLRGYVKVKRYEAHRLRGVLHIRSAYADFCTCVRLDSTHVKARRAAERIKNKWLKPVSQDTWGTAVVVLLATGLFLVAQYALFVGLPTSRDVVILSPQALTSLTTTGIDAGTLKKLRTIEGIRYTSDAALAVRVRELVGEEGAAALNGHVLHAARRESYRADVPISMQYYIALAVGAVVLFIAGVSLPQLTTLKVPGVQVDKIAADRTERVRSLGINR